MLQSLAALREFILVRWLTVILVALLCGCASRHGLKLIDLKDAKRAPWADAKTSLQPAEESLLCITGYGGRKVTIELWQMPDVLVQKTVRDIPAQKTYRSNDGFVYDTRGRDIVLTERETIYWTSTDYVLRLKPLPPGVYEIRLHSDDGRNDSTKFTVQGYP